MAANNLSNTGVFFTYDPSSSKMELVMNSIFEQSGGQSMMGRGSKWIFFSRFSGAH